MHVSKTVLLVGGGPVCHDVLKTAYAQADTVVAADSGALKAMQAGITPDLVVGDMDSIPQDILHNLPHHRIYDQNSTDFQKCLAIVKAARYICVGFSGGRLDHQLAAFSTMLQMDLPILLLDDLQLAFLAPPSLQLPIRGGTPVAFYPLCPLQAHINGTRWPVDGKMAPDGIISTSNIMINDMLNVQTNRRGLLVILPPDTLGVVLAAL